MAYNLVVTSLAHEAVEPLPEYVRTRVAAQLSILAEYPTALSQPSNVPYQEDRQLFRFQVEHLADRWTIVVLFQYGQDEQTLYVLAIGRSARDRADADEDEGPAV